MVYLRRILFLALYFVTPIAPILFYFQENNGDLTTVPALSVVLGIVSFMYLCNHLLLLAGAGFLEAQTGKTFQSFFQGVMVVVALALGAGHRELKLLQLAPQPFEATFALLLLVIPVLVALLYLLVWGLWRLPFLKNLTPKAQFGVKARNRFWSVFRDLFPVALGILLLHVLSSSTVSTVTLIWMSGWFTLSMGLCLYQKLRTIVSAEIKDPKMNDSEIAGGL